MGLSDHNDAATDQNIGAAYVFLRSVNMRQADVLLRRPQFLGIATLRWRLSCIVDVILKIYSKTAR